jgi:hypothetical protein
MINFLTFQVVELDAEKMIEADLGKDFSDDIEIARGWLEADSKCDSNEDEVSKKIANSLASDQHNEDPDKEAIPTTIQINPAQEPKGCSPGYSET